MGIRFRKSFKLPGGFRANFSKAGVGCSWGTKGFRITKTADGKMRKTYSIPRTGISYVKESKKKPTPKKRSNKKERSSMTFPNLSSRSPQKKRRKWPYALLALLLIIVIGSTANGTEPDTSQADQPTVSASTDVSVPADDADEEQEQAPDTSEPETIPDQAPETTQAPVEAPVQEPIQTPVTHTQKPTTQPTEPISSAPAEPTPAPSQDAKTIYVTPTGKRYHYNPHCNSGTYIPSTLQDALDAGLTPCKRCAGG